jgi:hypothetical protein
MHHLNIPKLLKYTLFNVDLQAQQDNMQDCNIQFMETATSLAVSAKSILCTRMSQLSTKWTF